jgi:hypothetical protein
MGTHDLPHILSLALIAIFAGTAAVELTSHRYIRTHFRCWRRPRRFYRVMGVLQLLAALFLSTPQLRVLGIILAGFVIFLWVVTLLNHRQWSWAVTGMLMMLALVPASLVIH